MGTRAYIGIKEANGTVTAIYNSCDGGLNNLGHILRKHFKTEEQVRELLAFGDISSVQTIQTYNELKETFPSVHNASEWSGLSSVPNIKIHKMPTKEKSETFNTISDCMGAMICYSYLFIPTENKWYYLKNGISNIKPLKA